jgi:hypothetical protein
LPLFNQQKKQTNKETNKKTKSDIYSATWSLSYKILQLPLVLLEYSLSEPNCHANKSLNHIAICMCSLDNLSWALSQPSTANHVSESLYTLSLCGVSSLSHHLIVIMRDPKQKLLSWTQLSHRSTKCSNKLLFKPLIFGVVCCT